MRISDTVLASVAALILAPVLLPLGVILLISIAVLVAPAIPALALAGLATLVVLVARSKQTGTDSALLGRRERSLVPAVV
jgi:hypothetical protein